MLPPDFWDQSQTIDYDPDTFWARLPPACALFTGVLPSVIYAPDQLPIPVTVHLEGNTSSMRAMVLLQMVCNALIWGQRLS